jgi:hypothetical protein
MIAATGGIDVRKLLVAVAGAAIACSGAAQALTVVVYVDPMTFDKHTRVFDTPGPDRFLMCVEPPGTAGCTELPIKKRR